MAQQIEDFISGQMIKATPEEIEAVQVFSKILVEDYGYPKENIKTRPQHRVKARPSDTTKEYPIDIGVFSGSSKKDDELLIIVECKKSNRKDGLTQLQDYLRFARAEIGVWFNGKEKQFLRKVESKGRVEFVEIPNIPKYGQRVQDVGQFLRRDLKPAVNLKSIFRTMRNYLAGNVVGATRDEVLAQQLMNLIFCKIYDEKFTQPDHIVSFRAGIDESSKDVAKRIRDLFKRVCENYNDVLDATDSIDLDDHSIVYVVGELQQFSLSESTRDAIGDAFEVFIDHALKGGQGQFFTPRNVVRMVVEIVDPSATDRVLDPACGSGGFLVESLRHVWQGVEKRGAALNWPISEIEIEKQKVAIKNFRGIDKDYFLGKVAKAYMALLGDGRGGIFCENSLDEPKNWQSKTQGEVALGMFDVIVTNPPFGAKIPVKGDALLGQYKFGQKWTYQKKEDAWIMGKIKDQEAPQVLFIERCLQFLKPGGKLGLVLPDGILGNDKMGYIRKAIMEQAKILAIVDVPIETFMPHTSTKTSVLVVQKLRESEVPGDYPVFVALAETCGHNRRGDLTPDDDIAGIGAMYHKWRADND